jgi:integral membrane sensor domain MASE1
VTPTLTATLPDKPLDLVERLQRWRATNLGRVAWYLVKVGLVTGIFYGATRFGQQLAYLHGTVGAIWPPVGIGIALLVIGGPWLWPGIFLGDILPTDWSAPLGSILGQTTGNVLEVLVAALLFMRLAGRRTDFERVWDVLALVVAAAVGTLISAVFGVTSLRLGHLIKASDVGSVFRTWWLGDFSGALVFAPVALVWATRRSWHVPRRRLVEGALLLVALIVLIEAPSQQDVPYIVFPVLIWAALRFGPFGAATAVAIASSLTVW